jgi:hypothetical protein
VKVRGEKSTSYLESELAARRIADSFPDSTILIILREPVARAISNYWFSVRNGFETLPMEEAFLTEDLRGKHDQKRVSVSPFAYLRRSLFADQIAIYEDLFTSAQVKVLQFERFVGSRTEAFNLFSALEVDPGFESPTLHFVVNAGDYPNHQLSHDLVLYLRDYFAESNDLLEKRYGFDLALWQNRVGR